MVEVAVVGRKKRRINHGWTRLNTDGDKSKSQTPKPNPKKILRPKKGFYRRDAEAQSNAEEEQIIGSGRGRPGKSQARTPALHWRRENSKSKISYYKGKVSQPEAGTPYLPVTSQGR